MCSLLSRYFTTSKWPFLEAKCKHVEPSESWKQKDLKTDFLDDRMNSDPNAKDNQLTLGSSKAPALTRYLTDSKWLFSAASIRGVLCSSEQLSKLAPAWSGQGKQMFLLTGALKPIKNYAKITSWTKCANQLHFQSSGVLKDLISSHDSLYSITKGNIFC